MRSTAATCAPAALAENLAIFFGRALQARGWRRHLRRRGAGEVASDPWRAGEDARFLARIGMHDFIWPTGCPNQRNKAYGYWGRCEGRWSPVLLHLLERIYEDTLRKVAWSLSLICHVDRKFNENPSRLHVKSIKEVTEVSALLDEKYNEMQQWSLSPEVVYISLHFKGNENRLENLIYLFYQMILGNF
ncbi:uncharacterized protein LOC124705592 isoform X5 [Lolium rigidum]|uniref:uncharacterized protein LOC124705592 isoform X5 n=1 Tax=Lolium rigidum TaxID=89674 RepID=UPI001F5E3476|nr:uncharacterized protein LOC124705592 isoform X5 [Lolium rigidum]